jgi:hypothetical protein
VLTGIKLTPALIWEAWVNNVAAMAVLRKSQPEAENDLTLSFNNGDLEVLQNAAKHLGFKDEVSLLRYLLAVISQSGTRTLTVIDKQGKSIALNPSASLLAETVAKPAQK